MTESRILRPETDFSGILKESVSYGSGRNADSADKLNNWFDTLMVQSGWGVSPAVVLMLCLFSALTLGGLIFVLHENMMTTALGVFVGFLLPIGAASLARSQRQTTMMKQIPPMLEELARAAKTGRSVEHSLQMVAVDTPHPLGAEMQDVSRKLQLGVPLRDALRELPYRTGIGTLNLLCTTLTVQQQTGGDLVMVLERLSRTVRDRILFLGRLRATTAASRATAILMVLLPPAVLAFFLFRDPEYMSRLFSSNWGRNVTLFAIGLELVGAAWVWRILQDSERT